MIITVSRQLGSDEAHILSLLSQQAGIPIIDRHAVEAAAERLGIANAQPAKAEEENLPPSTSGLRGLLTGPARYAAALTRTVQELTRTDSAILVGTAGAEILRHHPQALHLRLIARRDDRIRRVSDTEDVNAEMAARLIDESDHRRTDFHATLFGMKWSDPHQYHLVLNTSLLHPEQAVTLILLTLRALNPADVTPSSYAAPACWQHVTISREYGSGGHAFSARLANCLGWPCFDHELLHRSAAMSGIPVPRLIHIDERGPGFLERLHTMQESAKYFEGLREAITQAAREPSVIVGRGGYMLIPSDSALHLRFVATSYDRIMRTMQEHWLAESPARALVHDQDMARASFHRHYFRVDWGDPTLYHAVINTSRIALDPLANLIAGFVHCCQQGGTNG